MPRAGPADGSPQAVSPPMSGDWFDNPENLYDIRQGYDAYRGAKS